MEEQTPRPERPVNSRRRKRSKVQIFKETYLPVLIAGIAIILILVFVIGAIARAVENKKLADESRAAESASIEAENKRLESEAEQLLINARKYADGYDYNRALAVLDTFSGDEALYPKLGAMRLELENAASKLTEWNDPNQIPNLCFQPLIADTERAFTDATYGSSYNRHYVTTGEFSSILEALYANGYVLVSIDDFIAEDTDANGAVIYNSKSLFLPEGKKPIMITQVNVNYQLYMIDSDGDQYPDAGGDGFASKLIFDAKGNITCEMVSASGQTVTGAYDLVPILDSFVAKHPDFSYRGAKAILALTGYNGLFGYRTNAESEQYFGTAAFEKDVESATKMAEALRASGYTLACYTYENIAYGEKSLTEVQSDLTGWVSEVLPILGNVDILVYAQNSDIATRDTAYSGDKYNTLHDTGFRYFIGFADSGNCWCTISDNYVRQGRLLVTGSNLAHHSDWFTPFFDATTILEKSRGDVPG